jgi:RNA polymerase sigma-70 factor (ECF subfamily)
VPFGPLGDPDRDAAWLDPYPDSALARMPDTLPGPEARFEAQEAVRLAFIALIQELPPSQRAVLLLRDVIGLSAVETAEAVGSTVPAANSALQRARATLNRRFPEGVPRGPLALDPGQQRLLQRYVELWEASEIGALVQLLAPNAVWTMPPWSEWFVGREAIGAFLGWAWRSQPPGQRLLPTSANGQPAFGYYRPDREGPALKPFAIQVIDLYGDRISGITNFVDAKLFRAFDLPASLDPSDR